MIERFTFFWKTHSPFSQWHPSVFVVDDVPYTQAEQYMMAQKAIMFEGPELYLRDAEGNILTYHEYCGAPEMPRFTTLGKIMDTGDPHTQKHLGRDVKNFVEAKWNVVARDHVYRGNMAKFMQNPELRHALLMTDGTTLVEASPYDKIWGIGLKEDDPRAQDRATWLGTNWLGEVLTQVRDDIADGVEDREVFKWSVT